MELPDDPFAPVGRRVRNAARPMPTTLHDEPYCKTLEFIATAAWRVGKAEAQSTAHAPSGILPQWTAR